MAATKQPQPQRSTKKRKADPSASTTCTTASQPTKKKSPLYNLPQNKYVPPSASTMSKDELVEWRKEQRRKRNRESAAVSRGKSKLKQQRLEGERDLYKRRCQEMEEKMKEMEARIRQLERLAADGRTSASSSTITETKPTMTTMTTVGKVAPSSAAFIIPDEATSAPAVSIVPSVVSSSDSPDLFPALLSVAPMSAPQAEPRDAVEEHIMISRPAVKTGANLDVPRGSAGRLSASDGRDGKTDGTVEEGTADAAVVTSGTWALPPACSDNSVDSGSDNTLSESNCADDDECFLDLLVDTLDEGDFDPALLL